MKKIFAALSILFASSTFAQSNLQTYTPSVLFGKGTWEFKTFQNYYSQAKSFDANHKKQTTNRGRENYFTSINQFLYGLSDHINIGMDIWVKNVHFQNQSLSLTSVVGIGPKIKFTPLKQAKRLSWQMTYLIPVAKNLEGQNDENRPYLHNDGSLYLNQLFYDLQLNSKIQLFFQQAFWYNIVRNSFRENNFLQTQSSLFFSYFLDSRWTLYAMTEYFPTHYNDSSQKSEAFFSYFLQSGLGVKYQLIPNLIEVEALYTNFYLGSEGQGAGKTFNVGIRWINNK